MARCWSSCPWWALAPARSNPRRALLARRRETGWAKISGFAPTWAGVQRELACGADVNAKNDHGGTPLHYAAYRNDNSAVIEALLEAGADVNAKNDDGNTPLHWAGFNENAVVTEALLNADADVYAKNDDGKNASALYSGEQRKPGGR